MCRRLPGGLIIDCGLMAACYLAETAATGWIDECALASCMACHTESGVAGSVIWRTLNSCRASTMALMTAAGAAVVGPSPADLMPRGFVGERTCIISVCKFGR